MARPRNRRYEVNRVDAGGLVLSSERFSDPEEARAAERAGRYSEPRTMAWTIFIDSAGAESEMSGIHTPEEYA